VVSVHSVGFHHELSSAVRASETRVDASVPKEGYLYPFAHIHAY
jgi:hypothetical protein